MSNNAVRARHALDSTDYNAHAWQHGDYIPPSIATTVVAHTYTVKCAPGTLGSLDDYMVRMLVIIHVPYTVDTLCSPRPTRTLLALAV